MNRERENKYTKLSKSKESDRKVLGIFYTNLATFL